MIWTVIGIAGGAASIATLVGQVARNGDKRVTYVLLALLLVFFLVVGVVLAENQSLEAENAKLNSARAQAANLLLEWPLVDEVYDVSFGDCRGMVLSGLLLMEANREAFPETYESTRQLLLEELGAGSKAEEPSDERVRLREAAATIIRVLTSLRELAEEAAGRPS